MKGQRLCIDDHLSLSIISTLPQSILETILCFLPTKEAARTSILSREWRNKWTKIPKLDFYLSDVSITEEKQVIGKQMGRACNPFDDLLQILLLHRGPIYEFNLEIDLECDSFRLDQIILYLSKNHTVKKLRLYGWHDSYSAKLPLSVFSLHHLTDLNLSIFYLDPQQIFSEYGSLRSLVLNGIDVSSKSLLQLLSNCPALKSLTLSIWQSHSDDRDCTTIRLFKCLPLIEHLTIVASNLKWLVVDTVPQELPTLLVHLKYLYFEEISFVDNGLPYLLLFIKCSPNLEKIKLEIDSDGISYGEYSAVWEEYSNILLEQLVELEIECFNNLKPEMEFVKFIMARSPKLKKVSIRCRKSMEQRTEMLEVLLHAPRVSPVLIYV